MFIDGTALAVHADGRDGTQLGGAYLRDADFMLDTADFFYEHTPLKS